MSDYRKDLQFLGKYTDLEKEDGIEVYFKKTRNQNPGELNPYLAADMRKAQEGGTNQAVGEMPQDVDLSNVEAASMAALAMRQMMGSANVDLSNNIEVAEHTIKTAEGSFPVRVYRHMNQKDKAPAIIFYHGGGFIGGKMDVVENFCKGLSEKLPAVVINVGYHLAPEHPAPAATNDAYQAVLWVAQNADMLHADASKIVVSGDSAGGTLAAAASFIDREKGTNYIGMQALLYPSLTLLDEENQKYAWPIERFHFEKNLEKQMGDAFNSMGGANVILRTAYVRDQDPASPIYSPLSAKDKSVYPPTLLVSAEFDYLRPFANVFAKELEEAGVKTKSICYVGMMHAFIDKYGIFPQAEDCAEEVIKMMQEVFQD
ncbi:alpha/beta hydrolase [Listeria goaensis]|uniref:alpha/beta hydrolase n=1 Tax=Listeria goaensis TaxID=1649188 RepID=UPI000B589097|nr:alpha/beta hydrolase [Listeria goaensis]